MMNNNGNRGGDGKPRGFYRNGFGFGGGYGDSHRSNEPRTEEGVKISDMLEAFEHFKRTVSNVDRMIGEFKQNEAELNEELDAMRLEQQNLRMELNKSRAELSGTQAELIARDAELERAKAEIAELKQAKFYLASEIARRSQMLSFNKVLDPMLDSMGKLFNACCDLTPERLADFKGHQLDAYLAELEYGLSRLGIRLRTPRRGESVPEYSSDTQIVGIQETADTRLDGRVYKCSSWGYEVASDKNLSRKATVLIYKYASEKDGRIESDSQEVGGEETTAVSAEQARAIEESGASGLEALDKREGEVEPKGFGDGDGIEASEATAETEIAGEAEELCKGEDVSCEEAPCASEVCEKEVSEDACESACAEKCGVGVLSEEGDCREEPRADEGGEEERSHTEEEVCGDDGLRDGATSLEDDVAEAIEEFEEMVESYCREEGRKQQEAAESAAGSAQAVSADEDKEQNGKMSLLIKWRIKKKSDFPLD